MSQLGQSRHFGRWPTTSGLPLETDIAKDGRHVSKVPKADSLEPRDGRPLRAHLAGSLLPAITPLTVLDHQGTSERGLKNSTSR
jgi:hypothetical protein